MAGKASVVTSHHAGMNNHMNAMRKITVQVPAADLERAQAYTGEGVTETVRTALKRLAAMQTQEEFRKLRGGVQLSIDLGELRADREWPLSTPRR